MFRRCLVSGSVVILAVLSQSAVRTAQPPQGSVAAISVRTASVDGSNLQYLIAGRGPAIVLLHGYAETSRMWRPLMPRLGANFTVIAPDLPGIGGSAIPADGLDMTRAATRIHNLVKQLGLGKTAVVGHDIGLMVAYAYAAQFPADVDRLVLMDAFLPGVEGWEAIYNNPGIWHFRFNGPTPEALVRGRERTYFEHFWNNFAADKTRSLPEADRQAYAAAYARPGRMRAAWAYFVSFQQAAKDFARFSQTKLTMPVLSIGGEKANGVALARQVQLVATNAKSITLPNTGHWVMEENPQATMDALVSFLGQTAGTRASSSGAQPTQRSSKSAIPEMQVTPNEVRANAVQTHYDFTVVGAGAAGSVLAAELSASGSRVLVIEAGGPGDAPTIVNPSIWFYSPRRLGRTIANSTWPSLTCLRVAAVSTSWFGRAVCNGTSTSGLRTEQKAGPSPTCFRS